MGKGVIVGSGVGEFVIVTVGGARVGDTGGVVVACGDDPQAVKIKRHDDTNGSNRNLDGKYFCIINFLLMINVRV